MELTFYKASTIEFHAPWPFLFRKSNIFTKIYLKSSDRLFK